MFTRLPSVLSLLLLFIGGPVSVIWLAWLREWKTLRVSALVMLGLFTLIPCMGFLINRLFKLWVTKLIIRKSQPWLWTVVPWLERLSLSSVTFLSGILAFSLIVPLSQPSSMLPTLLISYSVTFGTWFFIYHFSLQNGIVPGPRIVGDLLYLPIAIICASHAFWQMHMPLWNCQLFFGSGLLASLFSQWLVARNQLRMSQTLG